MVNGVTGDHGIVEEQPGEEVAKLKEVENVIIHLHQMEEKNVQVPLQKKKNVHLALIFVMVRNNIFLAHKKF